MKEKKNVLAALALMCLLIAAAVPASAAEKTSYFKNTSVGTFYIENGHVAVGFRFLQGKPYYFYKETSGKVIRGQMASGLQKIDGNYYYFYPRTTSAYGRGQMAVDFAQVPSSKGSATMYFYPRGNKKFGQAATLWQTIEGKRYYFSPSGILQTGFHVIDGKGYYFAPSGKARGQMQTGFHTVKERICYFGSDGAVVKGWQTIDGKRYYFIPSGSKSCGMAMGLVKVDGKQYYFAESGKSRGQMQTGWQTIEGTQYYFDENGVYDPSKKPYIPPDPSRPMVALTFDDGPGMYTQRLLNCLESNNAKATFFLVGSSVPYYAQAVSRMAEMGCEVGSHSYSHPAFTTLSYGAMCSQVSSASDAIFNACGQRPTVFRLPYGDGCANPTVLSSLGLPSIFWSIDTRDWANTGNPQHTINEVLNHVRSGDIVLMHDIHYSSVVAAETIIPELIRRGYQLVTVSELAQYKSNITLQAGKTYYNFY